MKNKKKTYIRIGIILFAAIFIVLAIIFSPKIINRLRGNATSIDASNNNVQNGVVIDNNYLVDKSTNKIELKIYNGSSNKMIINSYIYRSFCNTSENQNTKGEACGDFTSVTLQTPIEVDPDSDYLLTIADASTLFTATRNNDYFSSDSIDVGISYTMSDNNYTLSTMSLYIDQDFDASLLNSIDCSENNDVWKCSKTSNNYTPEEFDISTSNSSIKNIKVKISDNDVYMDKSQKLEDLGLTYSIQSEYANNWFFANPQSSDALTNNIFGNATTANINEYFDYTPSSNLSGTGAFTYDGHSFTLSGTPKKEASSQIVIPGLYLTESDGTNTYSSDSSAYFTASKLPQFKLTVYDKSKLGEAVTNALKTFKSLSSENIDLSNYQLYGSWIESALELYYSKSYYSKYNESSQASGMVTVSQSEIDELTNKLNNYTLKYKDKANYTSLKAAYDAASAKLANRNNYTNDSLAVLDTLIAKYNNSQDLSVTYQTKVDNLTTKIVAATANLVEKDADYGAVNKAVSDAEGLTNTVYGTKTLYTTSTWNNLQDALKAVVVGKKISEQTVVDGYATAINNAISSLVKNDANYTEVDKLITDYQMSSAYKENWYTSATKKAVDDYIVYINNNHDKKIDEQATVDGYKTNLDEDIKALVLKQALGYHKTDAYKDGSEERPNWTLTFDEYKSIFDGLDKTKYTDDSVKLIENAIDTLNDSNNANITIDKQSTMNTLLVSLAQAYDALEFKSGDYTSLCSLYEVALNITRNYYDDASLKNLDTSLWSLVWNYNVNDQSKIDAETANLKKALSGLILKKADTSKLEDAYNKAVSIDSSYYANFGNVTNALKDYYKVKDYTINKQSLVDDATRKILSAINNLVYKNADYSQINSLVATISGLSANDYMNFDVVVNAQRSVIYGKNITEQASVDAMYNNLRQAFYSLKKKSDYKADYSKFTDAMSRFPQDLTIYSSSLEKEAKDMLKEAKAFPQDLTADKQQQVDDITARIEALLKKLGVDVSENETNTVILSYLKVNGEKIDISSMPFKYTAEYSVTEAKIDVGLSSSDSTYKVYGGNVLIVGDNNIYIVVTTKSGAIYDYKLIVTRKETSNYLSDLSVKDADISFNKTTQEYKVKVSKDTNKLDLSSITEDKNAKVTIKGNKNLKNGSKVTIEVKSSDGSIRVYTLDIVKSGSVSIKVILILLFILAIIATILKYLKDRHDRKNKKDADANKKISLD